MARLTERIVAEALDAVRWEAMEAQMPERLREACDEAAEGRRWALLRWRWARGDA
jgi:hypothetical protein